MIDGDLAWTWLKTNYLFLSSDILIPFYQGANLGSTVGHTVEGQGSMKHCSGNSLQVKDPWAQ